MAAQAGFCDRCEYKGVIDCDHSLIHGLDHLMKREGVGVDNAIAFTGHRPQKLPGGFNENHPAQVWIRDKIAEVMVQGYEKGYRWILTGGALGVDMWAAEAVLGLKAQLPKLRLAVFVPHLDQWSRWLDEQLIHRYWRIRQEADFVKVVVRRPYAPEHMHRRNVEMVRWARLVVAFWDGKKGGGTYQCLEAARRQADKRVYYYNPWTKTGHRLDSP